MIYCYYDDNTKPLELSDTLRFAISNFPLSDFKHIPGKIIGVHHPRYQEIGKEFKVLILDNICMGVCTFLGFTYERIPEPFRQEVLNHRTAVASSYFLVFEKKQKNNEPIIFVVARSKCDAFPV